MMDRRSDDRGAARSPSAGGSLPCWATESANADTSTTFHNRQKGGPHITSSANADANDAFLTCRRGGPGAPSANIEPVCSSENSDTDTTGTFFDPLPPEWGLDEAVLAPTDHVQRATATPAEFLKEHILDGEILRNIDKLIGDTAQVMSDRAAALAYWEARAVALEPARRRWRLGLLDHVRPILGKLHFPLIAEMLRAAGHQYEEFLADLQRGFPVAGPIHAGGVGTPDPAGRLAHGRPAQGRCPDLELLKTQNCEINRTTIRSAKPGKEAAAVWPKHKQEINIGKAGPAVPVEEANLSDILLVERFGVEEWRSGVLKVRIIDNFRKNGVNSYASLWERIWNDTQDDLTEAVRLLQGTGSVPRRVLLGKDDFVGAFKTVCPAPEHRWLMWALVYDTDADRWVVSELRTQPFGALGGVYAWWRCGQAIRSIMVRLFWLVFFIYVDDVFLAELDSSAERAKHTFQRVVGLLGWDLDPEKSEGMSDRIDVLGCTAQIATQGIRWSLTESKSHVWSMQIRAVLERNAISAGEASKLAGRLCFAMSRVLGRIGRAWIRPLLWRRDRKTPEELNRRLRCSLLWWLTLLEQKPQRLCSRFTCHMGVPDVLVYTDADGAGGIGVFVHWCATSKQEYASGEVPRRWRACMEPRKTQINMYELSAVLAAWETWSSQLAGSRVAFFIDNKPALDIVLSGWSRHADLNWVAGQCWLRIAAAECTVMWSWVPSKSNPADAPSRGDLRLLYGARRSALRWPPLVDDWAVPLV